MTTNPTIAWKLPQLARLTSDLLAGRLIQPLDARVPLLPAPVGVAGTLRSILPLATKTANKTNFKAAGQTNVEAVKQPIAKAASSPIVKAATGRPNVKSVGQPAVKATYQPCCDMSNIRALSPKPLPH